jgi:hypothetical protein
MTRARRTFDRADLRRATLADLTATLEELDRTPRPDAKAARRSLTNHKNAVRREISFRIHNDGRPSTSPHRGLPARNAPDTPRTDDLGLAAFFEDLLGSGPDEATNR